MSRTNVMTGPGAAGDDFARVEDVLTPERELELLNAHKSGDAQALATLLRSYQRRLYSVCYRMLRNPEEAADLTQDTLVRVIERIGDFDGRARLSTWVIRIAINGCLTHLRKEKIRQHASLEAPVTADGARLSDLIASAQEHSAADRVEHDDRRRVLLRALRRLEPEERAVLVLRDLQGLDYQQIGEVFEVPLGTVKSRLFRARAALRQAAEAEGL
ncbi:MAG: sigma-70 family RNA polymerase sigma factor [Planctomycetota bacterium]